MKKYHILIVDDEPENLKSIVHFIEASELPYELYQALNGKAALEIAKAKLPDLVICDWDMPDMDGLELIRNLKANESTREISVIMFTGIMTTSEHLEVALDAGAIDYIRKPLDQIELLARVRTVLQLSDSFKKVKGHEQTLLDQNQLLEKTVQEKTAALNKNQLLMKEMNHRVKNNLAIIQSLLNLQSYRMGDDQSRSVLKESANRVHAVSKIHEMLSKTIDLKEVIVSEYVHTLVNDLAVNFDIDKSIFKINLKLNDTRLDMNILIPFALILNELVTNTFKHAFTNIKNGEILISLNSLEHDKVEFTIKDNGVGLPEGFNIDSADSLGMQIISSLVEQIKGEIEYHSAPQKGSEFKILFSSHAL